VGFLLLLSFFLRSFLQKAPVFTGFSSSFLEEKKVSLCLNILMRL